MLAAFQKQHGVEMEPMARSQVWMMDQATAVTLQFLVILGRVVPNHAVLQPDSMLLTVHTQKLVTVVGDMLNSLDLSKQGAFVHFFGCNCNVAGPEEC